MRSRKTEGIDMIYFHSLALVSIVVLSMAISAGPASAQYSRSPEDYLKLAEKAEVQATEYRKQAVGSLTPDYWNKQAGECDMQAKKYREDAQAEKSEREARAKK